MLNTHNVPAPVTQTERKARSEGPRALLKLSWRIIISVYPKEPQSSLSPTQRLLRPRISALPPGPSPQAALWRVLAFASQLLSWGEKNRHYRRLWLNPTRAACAASTPTRFRLSPFSWLFLCILFLLLLFCLRFSICLSLRFPLPPSLSLSQSLSFPHSL